MTGMLLVGALVGIGLTMLLAGLMAPQPHLGAAVARLSAAGRPTAAPSGDPIGAAHPLVARAGTRLADSLGLDRHRADLLLTGGTATGMALAKAGYAATGLLFPLVMTAILSVSGLALPVAVPLLAGLALAAGMSVLPEAELRRRSALARLQMRRTVCAYLELVALERAADAGAVESLERAAAIGAGPGFEHIRSALLRARLEGRTPWQQLAALADELAVPELGDVADIMRLSGEDGAAVLPTLRARAASLRTSLLQADVTAANEASERMSIPVALLGVAFMALLGFPALWRILFG